MKITDETITTYRMQVCVDCKKAGDNFLTGDELCHGNNQEIEDCIDANLDSMGCDL